MSGLFSFADTIAGYVTGFDPDHHRFGLETTDGRAFDVRLTGTMSAEIIHNLDQPYLDTLGAVHEMLDRAGTCSRTVSSIPNTVVSLSKPSGSSSSAGQTTNAASRNPTGGSTRWLRWATSTSARSFLAGPVDFRDYRTTLTLSGAKGSDYRQETDTISRLVYGFATAYLLTGDDRYLEGAEKGTEYLRDHMRFFDTDEDIVYWYHGIDVKGDARAEAASPRSSATTTTRSRCTSRSTRWPARPRPTASPATRGSCSDIDAHDPAVRPVLPRPARRAATSRTSTRSRSIRAARALGPQPGAEELELGRRPRARLPDQPVPGDRRAAATPISSSTPSTPSRSTSRTTRTARSCRSGSSRTGATIDAWGWQQNRAVVGHNLKIAWNLMRMNSAAAPSDEYVDAGPQDRAR